MAILNTIQVNVLMSDATEEVKIDLPTETKIHLVIKIKCSLCSTEGHNAEQCNMNELQRRIDAQRGEDLTSEKWTCDLTSE